MHDTVASWTAMRVALRRAEHQVLEDPVVFKDPLSLRIIGPEAAAAVQPGRISRRQRLTPSFRAFMAARSRFAEDELAEAAKRGVRQYVILGAGLDTFGYRNPHAAEGLRVFELDHPATQEWKRGQLGAAGIEIPAGTILVPADLERSSLESALRPAGFRLDEPAFFSWLGVVAYLTEQAFEQTLAFVASLPPGSAIVFDYAVPRESLNPVQKKAFDALATRVGNVGEPLRLFHEPAEMRLLLTGFGFKRIEDLGHEGLNRLYFSGRTDGFRVKSRLARLVYAG